MKNFIAPSILSADFAKLGKEVDDVMDMIINSALKYDSISIPGLS